MTIEESVFQKKRFNFEQLKSYGFQKASDSYIYETDFMNGDFHAIVKVSDSGSVSGKVIDKFNDEEYRLIRMESQNGPFVSLVRSKYTRLLEDIANSCTFDVPFSTDQANRITERIFASYSVHPDFPFDDCSGVFRHIDSRKWFGLIMLIKWKSLLKNNNETLINVMNLKIDPEDSSRLTHIKGIFPAFHMNHTNWISVVLGDELDDDFVMELVENSYKRTKKKK